MSAESEAIRELAKAVEFVGRALYALERRLPVGSDGLLRVAPLVLMDNDDVSEDFETGGAR